MNQERFFYQISSVNLQAIFYDFGIALFVLRLSSLCFS